MQDIYFDNYGNITPYEVIETDLDTLYWLHTFQKSRPDRNRVMRCKGFIQINIYDENIK